MSMIEQKRTTLVSTVLALIVAIAAQSNAFALTSANLHLQGTVDTLVSISVTSAPSASSLDLHNSASNLKVADVQEFSNSSTGYQVTLVSANAGNLRNTSASGEVIKDFTYSATYNGSAVQLSQSPQQITLFQSPINDPVTFTKEFTISYTGIPQNQLPSGVYQDDLTFEIAAL